MDIMDAMWFWLPFASWPLRFPLHDERVGRFVHNQYANFSNPHSSVYEFFINIRP